MTPEAAGSSVRPDGSSELSRQILSYAREEGFAAAGIAGLEPFDDAREHVVDALRAGRMEGMPWMHERRADYASDLGARVPWARSVVAMAWPYATFADPGHGLRGRIAAYASGSPGGRDYHELAARHADAVAGRLRASVPTLRSKVLVDHTWAFDRAIAARAGIGFLGKNACLITKESGSFVVLCALLVSVELPPSVPAKTSCGSCSTCLQRCPTGAIVAPFTIDARKCISYWTIEHKGPIPDDIRPQLGTWIFGCDVCQTVCPINERRSPAPLRAGASTGPEPFPELLPLLDLTEEGFAARYAGTAVERAGYQSFLRNVALALGNAGDSRALGPLGDRLAGETDPVIRDALDWALRTVAARTGT